MPAKPLISEAQWELLLHYMQEHPNMARGSVANDGPLAKRRTTKQWGELASQLNCLGTGTTKTPEKWRDYWNNAKYGARKKACARRQQAFQAGRGIPMLKKLTELTEREQTILALIGRVALHGEESVRIPFETRKTRVKCTVTSGGGAPKASLMEENETQQRLSLTDEASSPGKSTSEFSVSNDTEDLPKFTPERIFETTSTDPLCVQKTCDSKPELEKFNVSRKIHRAEKSVFSFVRKPVAHPRKIIRIEIHDADSFPSAEQSLCNCQAEVCVQYAVKGNRFEDDEVYRYTMEVIAKIQEHLETR